MINVIEAYESTVNSEFVDWIKMSVFAGLVYLSYHFYNTSQTDLFHIVGGATTYLLLVLMLCVINTVRNGKNYIFPKFISAQFIVMSLAALVSIIPFSALLIWLGMKILSLNIFTYYPEVVPVCQWLVWIIISGIIFLAVMILGKTGNPLSLFDFKTISNYSIDVLPHLLFTLVIMAFFNAVILGMTAYIFWVFLSVQHPIFIAICSFALVINIVSLGNCFAQIEYEVVPREEEEHII